jgi:hypothetical protein
MIIYFYRPFALQGKIERVEYNDINPEGQAANTKVYKSLFEFSKLNLILIEDRFIL